MHRTAHFAACLFVLVATLTTLACQPSGDTAAPEPQRVEGTASAADGTSVAYDARGAGEVALVFVHCWACDRSYWHHQLDAFADDYRVVSLDLGGHGQSGHDRDQWTLAGLAGDVVAVADELGLERMVLIGHSMGGPVALLAAARMPGRVLGVVGIDTLHDAGIEITPEMAEQMATGFEQDFSATMGNMVAAAFPEGSDPEVKEWVTARATAADPEVAVSLIRDFPNFDLAAALAGAGVPVRVINAAPRPPYAPETAVETNRQYADFDAIIVEGVGHFLLLERPEEVNADLRGVVEELVAAAPSS